VIAEGERSLGGVETQNPDCDALPRQCQLFAQAASKNGKALIVPPLINYSGVLNNSAGEPLTGVWLPRTL
jgi:hypothetical protein